MAVPVVPKGLRAGGKALWSYLATDGMAESHVALLTEACRARDRLDQLDEILSGEAEVWATLVHRTRTDDYELHIAAALTQANSTAAGLRALLDKIPAPAVAKPEPAKGGGTALDQLAERRGQRDPVAASSTRARAAERRRPRK